MNIKLAQTPFSPGTNSHDVRVDLQRFIFFVSREIHVMPMWESNREPINLQSQCSTTGPTLGSNDIDFLIIKKETCKYMDFIVHCKKEE